MALDTIPKQEGGKLKAVASGTLPSGQPVVVNADGTVSVAAETSISQSVGSPTQYSSTQDIYLSSAYDSNAQKVVLAYRGASGYGRAIVGTISGNSISFGTEAVFNSEATSYISATYDSNAQKIVIAFTGGNSKGRAVVGTISGTNISFGSVASFNPNINTFYCSATYDSNAQKVVIAHKGSSTSSTRGAATVGTVSGTSISFGTPVVFEVGTTQEVSCVYDASAQKVVIAFSDVSDSQRGKAIVGTVSGTTISFGGVALFNSGVTNQIKIAYDDNTQKVVIAYRDGGNSNYGTAIVGTVSGTAISFGSEVVFESAHSYRISMAYDSFAKKIVIAYQDVGNSLLPTAIAGTVSGTSINFESSVVLETDPATNETASVYDQASKKVVIAYVDNPNDTGEVVLFTNAATSTNLTSENYIGMSQGFVAGDSATQALGSPTLFENASTEATATTFDRASGKVVIAYADGGNSGYGTAIVGTVSGTSISFGSAVVYRSAYANNTTAAYDANTEKVVISYRDLGNSGYGTSIVGTVSGTSISFGSAVVFESADVRDTGSTYDSNSQKVVVTYRDTGNSSYGTAVVGTVSGNSISFGTPVVYEAASSQYNAATFDTSNNKVVIAYRDNGTTHGTAIVGTVSGTSISFGTAVAFEASSTERIDCDYDAQNEKIVIAYQDVNNSQYCTAIVGTVSGTSISFGSASVFDQVESQSMSVTYDETAQRTIISYSKVVPTPQVGRIVVCTVTGTSISFSSPVQFEAAEVQSVSSSYDSNAQKVVTCYVDAGNSSKGTSVVFQPAYTNITRGQVADGGAATVDIVGTVSTNQLSLTAGQQYFVQTDGTLGLTAADPSVLAGTAISATKLIVKT
jgi:hypothetical protein